MHNGIIVTSLGCRYIVDWDQSKQYLTTHTIDDGKITLSTSPFQLLAHETLAHPTDIYSLSTTASQIFSSSGSSSIKVYSFNQPDYPLCQALDNAHKLGCHHTATSGDGHIAASVGFGGEVKIWGVREDGRWSEKSKVVGAGLPIPKLSQAKRRDR